MHQWRGAIHCAQLASQLFNIDLIPQKPAQLKNSRIAPAKDLTEGSLSGIIIFAQDETNHRPCTSVSQGAVV